MMNVFACGNIWSLVCGRIMTATEGSINDEKTRNFLKEPLLKKAWANPPINTTQDQIGKYEMTDNWIQWSKS